MLSLSSQLLELLIVFYTVEQFLYGISKVSAASAHATSKSGPVRRDSMPTGLSVLIIPLQGFIYLLVPTIYILTITTARFQRSPWLNAFALSEDVFGFKVEGVVKNVVRVLACVASIALQHLADGVYKHLGDQFHPIGRREKPRVVQTGPYAWVRHPLYIILLLQEALWSLMFWSYAPLVALGALVVIFTVKIPIEEAAIERDEVIKEEYCAYKRKVTAKLIPHVW